MGFMGKIGPNMDPNMGFMRFIRIIDFVASVSTLQMVLDAEMPGFSFVLVVRKSKNNTSHNHIRWGSVLTIINKTMFIFMEYNFLK